MVYFTRGLAVLAIVALAAGGVGAESMNFKPGKWKFDSSAVMPMMPEPQKSSETKCITEEIAKQDPLAELVEKGGCKILSRRTEGDTLHFSLECRGESNMTSTGKGTFTASGDKASGSMDIEVAVPQMADMPGAGGKMKMTQKWTGERLGPCD